MVRKRRTATGPLDSLNAWMEFTGCNATMLARLLAAKGHPISKGHLSSVLSRSCRISARKAMTLHELTSVPLEKLLEWPPKMGDAVGETDRAYFRDRRTSPANSQIHP